MRVAPLLRNAYQFDAMGNRVSTKNEANHTQVDASYNGLNQMSRQSTYNIAGQAPVFTGRVNYGYDGDGNQTSAEQISASGASSQVSYVYDDMSQLVSVTVAGSSRTEFFYDGMNRLRISIDYVWNGNGWSESGQKRRIYDGMDVVQERNTYNQVTASVTRAGNIGGILARSTFASSTTGAGGTSYFAYDPQGNVTTLTDSSGVVVGSYTYDAWGNVLASSGARAGENPYRFSTKEQLGGLYSFGFRFYNAGTGRWINRDPLGESGGFNLYAGMANNPINMVDPYGLATDPQPGSGNIRIVFNAFIPTPAANGPIFNNPILGTAHGDNRGFSSNGGTYRAMHTVILNPKTGGYTSWEAFGVSSTSRRAFGLLPPLRGTQTDRSSISTTVSRDCSGWNVHIQGNGRYPFSPQFATPGITYDIRMHVNRNGSTSGSISHDGYPAYEVWGYAGGKPPTQIYGRMPGGLNSAFSLASPDLSSISQWGTAW